MHHQRGMSLVGWLIVLAFIGCIALVVIRVVPVYAEAWTVRSVINGLQEDRDLARSDRNAILRSLQKRLEINNVRSVGRDDITIQAADGGTEVVIDYETRFPLIGNIDGIAHFRNTVTIRP